MLVAGRSRCFVIFCALLMTLLALPKLFAGPPVALTDPLTPQEERKKFKLPPGFDIQLVAAEPDIQKPMNLAFDAKGRLWVTHSVEYPFAVADAEKSRDGLTILDGIGPDGRATKVTKFADKLNIPIGVLPLPSGNEAIVWSIPNIWKLTDTDGDGKADKREVLYGPFDFVDTHGDQNAFRLGNDGWVYACHGFRNASKIKLRGAGPVVLEMQSGNAYRFKIDGSAIEQISWGQVNPFGMCVDARGDLFTADCHSKPITMLLRGGHYDSFGKPDDGLGFAPITTSNDHGSTGIAGVVSYSSNHFPAEYAGSMFVGNVVTNIIHRDTVQWRGSSPWVEKPEDFLTSEDWWFHPVDLQLGPDGALYVSDFYNSIIGHYEVDLKHPRRDRERGRIWRIVYTGKDQKNAVPAVPNLTALSPDELLARFSDSNMTVRNLASYEFQKRVGSEGAARVKANIEQPLSTDAAVAAGQAAGRAQGLWLLWRLGQLDESLIQKLSQDPSPLVRVHLVRALGETATWSPAIAELVRAKLKDADPFVQRATAEALASHPDPMNLQPLVQAWNSTPSQDVQLIHAIRISIRNQLRPAAAINQIASVKLNREELAKVVDIALAVPSESAAWFTFEYIRQHEVAQPVVEKCLRHVARYVGNQRLDEVAEYVQKKFPDDMLRQTALFQSLFAGLTQGGGKLTANSTLGKWATSLATKLLDPQRSTAAPWENQVLPGAAAINAGNPWGVTHRNSTDGNTSGLFFDSIHNGEHLTGVLRSAPFVIPETLHFWMCGHNGLPTTNSNPVNHVRLKLFDSGETIAKEVPPRSDIAREYKWDLKKWAGQQGVFEVVDADTGTAYAWLGVGRFEPEVVANPVAGLAFSDTALITAIQLADQLKLMNLSDSINQRLRNSKADIPVRIAAANSELNLNRPVAIEGLIAIVQNPTEPGALRLVAAQLLSSVNTVPSRTALAAALSSAPGALQQPFAISMAGTSEGGEMLFSLIAAGKASAQLLQDKPILDRLNSISIPNREQRIKDLTQGLTAPDERLKQLTAKLAASFSGAEVPAEAGQAIFKKTCMACHRLNNDGGKLGPQLDGVGNRGLERLLEDVLDPNRNVDGAFRATVVTTNNGLVVTGLKLREEGKAIILGNNEGKEVRIPLEDIDESRTSNLSIMPPNFAQQLSEPDLKSLISYLLRQKQAVAEPKPAN
jgi:putative heme-binding domain-containing protein